MKKILLLIPVFCLICVGCASGNNTGSQKANGQGSNGQASSADWAITTKVKAAIMADSSLSASSRMVSVSTTNGVVTLSGNVASQSDMDRIMSITQGVNGVQSVDNQMTVSSS